MCQNRQNCKPDETDTLKKGLHVQQLFYAGTFQSLKLFLHGQNRFVLPDIRNQRNNRQCKRNPDKNLFQYDKNTTKVKNQQNDHDHLRCSLKFSPVISSDDNTIFGCNKAKTTDNKFPANNNNYKPGWQTV